MNTFEPFFISLEVTKRCKKNCVYCRANAKSTSYKNELTTEEYYKLLDDIADHFNPIIILTGGDPMEREDIFRIAEHATKAGLYVVLSACGHSYNEENLQRLKDAGVTRISLSLDGATPRTHDEISGREGSFDEAMESVELCRKVDMPFQIHTTIVKQNFKDAPIILELSRSMGASGYQPFFFVAMGRGSNLADQSIPPEEYEKLLTWLYEKRLEMDMHYEKGNFSFLDKFILRPSCAPQFTRIVVQGNEKLKASNPGGDFSFEETFSGCMGGKTFVFISNTGKVQPCGMLEVECGDIRQKPFSRIWETSNILQDLRDTSKYKGKCRTCSYLKACSGCRARAYVRTGDYLEEDFYCLYNPINS